MHNDEKAYEHARRELEEKGTPRHLDHIRPIPIIVYAYSTKVLG